MKKQDLMKLALLYVEKGYGYEQLMDGDDLYDASPDDKHVCGEYLEECRDIGLIAFRKKIEREK